MNPKIAITENQEFYDRIINRKTDCFNSNMTDTQLRNLERSAYSAIRPGIVYTYIYNQAGKENRGKNIWLKTHNMNASNPDLTLAECFIEDLDWIQTECRNYSTSFSSDEEAKSEALNELILYCQRHFIHGVVAHYLFEKKRST